MRWPSPFATIIWDEKEFESFTAKWDRRRENSALQVARKKFGDCFSVLPIIADADIARERDAVDGLR